MLQIAMDERRPWSEPGAPRGPSRKGDESQGGARVHDRARVAARRDQALEGLDGPQFPKQTVAHQVAEMCRRSPVESQPSVRFVRFALPEVSDADR
jgi:hypothetical protein